MKAYKERWTRIGYRRVPKSRQRLVLSVHARPDRVRELTSGDTNGSGLGGTVCETSGIVLGGGRSKVDDDSSLLVRGPEWSVLVGTIWVVEGLVDSVGNVCVDNKSAEHIDVEHLRYQPGCEWTGH